MSARQASLQPQGGQGTALPERYSSAAGPMGLGMLLVLTIFVGLGVWAAFAQLGSAILASGTLVVEGDRKVVQHLEGGIAKRILVKDGDRVAQGDPLIVLEDIRSRAVHEIVKGQLDAARATEARLLAERDGADHIRFPPELLADQDAETQQAIAGQRQLFAARRQATEGQIEILEQRIAQFREEIAGLQAQEDARARQLQLWKEEIEGLTKLSEQGNIARNYVLDKKRRLAELRGERGKFRADVARAEQGIAGARLQIGQLQKTRQEEVATQLRETEKSIADLQERLVASKDTLDRTVIRAPVSGIVFGLTIHNPGAVVTPGQDILYIVPQDDELIVDSRVDVNDIEEVAVGQESTIRFTALSFRNTPVISGTVIYVSPDSQTDRVTGAPYYAVKVRVSPESLTELKDTRLQPGMPVEAMIETGSRTMLNYLLKPLEDLLQKAFLEK